MRRIRILHTADWHLGHTLLGHGREYEHASFLGWLLDRCADEDVDVLIVAGDVFDGRSPSGAAQAAYFGFLAALRTRCPHLEVVIVAGNHDSPSRLASAGPVLGMLGVHVVGAASPHETSALSLSLVTRGGPIGVVAVPFVRPSDLADVGDGLDTARVERAVSELYAAVTATTRAAVGTRAPLVATGHAHLRGAVLSPKSERLLFGGEAGSIDRAIYGDDLAYVALGHLHLAQDVGAERALAPRVRYAGSPIPLALVESSYAHSVSLVELEGEALSCVRTIEVPRFVEMLSIGGEDLPSLLERLEALPRATDLDPRRHAWLEIKLALGPEARVASVRAEIERAVSGRAVRLVRSAIEAPASMPPPEREGLDLAEVDVREVVRRRWSELGEGPLTAAHERALGRVLLRATQTIDDARAQRAADRAGSGELA